MLSKGKLRTSRSRSRLTVTTFNAWRADKMLLGIPIFLYLEWKRYSNIFFPLSLKDTWKLRNRHFRRNKIKLIWIYNNKKPSFRTFEHSSRSKIFFCVSRIIDKFWRKRYQKKRTHFVLHELRAISNWFIRNWTFFNSIVYLMFCSFPVA